MLNQYQDDFECDLSQYESVEDVQAFLNDAIEQLPKSEVLPKGHLAKPMKWENGHFHITEAGLYFVEEDKNGISHKRFISSPVLVTAKTRDDSSNNWGVLLQWKDDNGVKHIQALSMELFQTDGADLRKALSLSRRNDCTRPTSKKPFSMLPNELSGKPLCLMCRSCGVA